MKEDFLHHIWKFKKFNFTNLHTTRGDKLTIINSGQYLQQAGPDFFNAQIIIGDQKWAGNIEIHLKSSDWYAHHHETDTAYENVILHVVWEHDAEIYRKNNSAIATLEIENYVDPRTLKHYLALSKPKSWIFCENQLAAIDSYLLANWLERLLVERLERKTAPVMDLLLQKDSDWEAVLFCLLARNFGLNTNGEVFMKAAQNIPFSIFRKENTVMENLEALLLGTAGLLDAEKEDNYFKDLKFRYRYLLQKYGLEQPEIPGLQFFKLRPDNFPTVRLSQLAACYHNQQQLFASLMDVRTAAAVYGVFDVRPSLYWQTHYTFDHESKKRRQQLSKNFIDLLIINTIIPLQFAYCKSRNSEVIEELLDLLKELPAEKNAVIDKFRSFGVVATNAFESQALLQLKNEYCDRGRCLDCQIGHELLKNESDYTASN